MRFASLSRLVLAAGCAAAAACARPAGVGTAPPDALRAEVTAMMDASARAWNRGDLDAFMADYAPGATTTYIGSRGLLRGPEAIRAAYAPRFAPGGVRDSLSFELADVDAVAPDAIHVIAYYTLARRTAAGRDSVTARGPTSLLMRRQDGRWRIVHDHSS